MEDSVVESFKSGLENRCDILRKAVHIWELYALIILIIVILLFSANFLYPTFFAVDESEWVPDQQEIEYMFLFNDSAEYEGEVEITCEPVGKFAKTDSQLNCTYVFLDPAGQDEQRFSEDVIDNLKGSTFVNFQWTELQLDNYRGGLGNVPFYDFHEMEGGDYIITGEFAIPTPSIPGNHYLTFDTGDQLDLRSGTGQPIIIYSDSEIADFEYRESVAPLEQLVVIGLLIAFLRLCLTLSDRIVEKTKEKKQH